ncbi:DUF4395 domain-containing protein [Ilumatobacter sp.]|uniref:DUF4395 domain-containing protein n=1 Tax=Ilumatobacter sp. TaxID=1967498 RepID=UPI003751816E
MNVATNRVQRLFNFPDPVNETSARLVAFGVVVQAAAFLVFHEGWMLGVLVFGFVARVLTGPTLSPLGQFSTRVATPVVERLMSAPSRRVPGPPKRFAQGIGLGCTAGAAVGWLVGAPTVSFVLIAMLIIAASLEAFAAFCLGCIAYAAIWGCDDCDDISERLRRAVAQSQVAISE